VLHLGVGTGNIPSPATNVPVPRAVQNNPNGADDIRLDHDA
jgi:hypothetical protein